MKTAVNEVKEIYVRQMMDSEPLTVGELMKKLERMPKKAKVYMVFDKYSDGAWDDEKCMWRYAIPLVYVSKETNIMEDMYDASGKEINVLLEVENP